MKTQGKLKREERTMRLRKLGPALVAATSLLAVAPALASAHRPAGNRPAGRHPSPLGRCRIDIESFTPLITAGDQIEIKGSLACSHANAGGQPVELYAHVDGTAGFVPVQSTTTEAGTTETRAFYKFTTPAESTNTSFYVSSDGARSGSRRLRVAALVTLSGPPEGTQIETGAPHKETFTGTVNPAAADVGARVILQRQDATSGDEWHRIGVGYVLAGGTFSITHIFRVPGDASIRALVRSDGLNIPSPSNELEYDISQAQNPSLTIVSSADPISYGQQVTISGVLTGATTPQTVTLEARTVRQRGFAPVAEVSTGAGGAYSFPAQTPVNNTLYRVKGAGQKSAVLYEGVRDVLTAEVSASTVEASQTLEFKGTVTPEHNGHVIYLERENASGTGFHVVQKGYVLGSTYSIVHQFYVPGTKVYRIDFPGGPENGRAVSQPFTVQVTPAPASALTQEAPGNSSLPPEGQTKGSEAEKPLSE
jgi:hypothetical protein